MDSLELFAVAGADLFECAQIVGAALGVELRREPSRSSGGWWYVAQVSQVSLLLRPNEHPAGSFLFHDFREHPFLLLASGNDLSSVHRALTERGSGRVIFLKRELLEPPN